MQYDNSLTTNTLLNSSSAACSFSSRIGSSTFSSAHVLVSSSNSTANFLLVVGVCTFKKCSAGIFLLPFELRNAFPPSLLVAWLFPSLPLLPARPASLIRVAILASSHHESLRFFSILHTLQSYHHAFSSPHYGLCATSSMLLPLYCSIIWCIPYVDQSPRSSSLFQFASHRPFQLAPHRLTDPLHTISVGFLPNCSFRNIRSCLPDLFLPRYDLYLRFPTTQEISPHFCSSLPVSLAALVLSLLHSFSIRIASYPAYF